MIFKVKSTAVEISFWFAAVITLLLLFFGESSAVCFVLCILHEAGHLAAMLRFGSVPEKIELGFYGMKIVADGRLLSPKKEIITAAAGPVVNLILAAALYLFRKEQWALLSFGLGIFNLLPVTVLDGGRILSNFVHDEKQIKIIGFYFSMCLLAVGIAAVVRTKSNFTLLIVSLYLIIGCVTSKK